MDSYKRSLPRYIDHYDTVVDLMIEACRAMVDACEPIRRWIAADSKYPTHLQQVLIVILTTTTLLLDHTVVVVVVVVVVVMSSSLSLL